MPFSFISPKRTYDFIRICKYAYAVSLLLLLCSAISLYMRGGIPLGVDFQGGSLVQILASKPISAEKLRMALEKTSLQDIVIQSMGSDETEYSIRFSSKEAQAIEQQEQIMKVLESSFTDITITIERTESVGAKVSKDTKEKALEALYYAILVITIYISGRFEDKWIVPLFITGVLASLFFIFVRFSMPVLYIVPIILVVTIGLFVKFSLPFALGAIISLLHDVILTSGILLLLGISFDLSIVAALLAILGYSLNDTIIVYDRIREYLKKNQKAEVPLREIINTSISSTLTRTVLTSVTTLLVLISLLLFGGALLFPFALTITIGVLVGTLSSIFIASPTLLFLGITVKGEESPIIIDENGVV